jgi:hypothetical protein
MSNLLLPFQLADGFTRRSSKAVLKYTQNRWSFKRTNVLLDAEDLAGNLPPQPSIARDPGQLENPIDTQDPL